MPTYNFVAAGSVTVRVPSTGGVAVMPPIDAANTAVQITDISGSGAFFAFGSTIRPHPTDTLSVLPNGTAYLVGHPQAGTATQIAIRPQLGSVCALKVTRGTATVMTLFTI